MRPLHEARPSWFSRRDDSNDRCRRHLRVAIRGGAPRLAGSTQSHLGLPVSIAYERHGKADRTLVFAHGWSCNRSHWRFQVDALRMDYRVVVLDLAGHGESGSNRTVWSIANFAQDVAAVVDALDASNVVLIGHSLGGPVVLEAALLRPRQVIGVIGVDATTMFDGATA